MSAVSNNLLIAGDDGYVVDRSVRLRSSASAYLNRTPSVAGNRKTWTWGGWIKIGTIGSAFGLISTTTGTAISIGIGTITSANQGFITVSGVGVGYTAAVFRDPSAWYHIVIAFDTTQAIASNRVKFYVNNVLHPFHTTLVSQNTDYAINNNSVQEIGTTNVTGSKTYLDGYLTEINFIDGQALTPDSFGEYDSITGVWKPAKYTGTYGTNGFYLDFSDNTTTTTLAEDKSGNGNDWAANNISLTSGVTYDSMTDTPTIYAGGGNYATWNPLTAGGLVTFSEANLKAVSTSASAPYNIESTIKSATTGKWYAEVTMAAGANNPLVGIGNNPSTSNANTDQWAGYRRNATYVTGGMGASSTGTPATFTTNDVIGIAYSADAGTLAFYKNGTLQTGGFTGITAGNYSFIVRKDSASGDGGYLNCGQRPFAYTPPDGFKELHTGNLPEPEIVDGSQYFNTVLYTGNGTSRSITGVGFQPDLVWGKNRATAWNHTLFDSVRGATKLLQSNLTNAESVNDTWGYLSSFDTDGFSLVTGASGIDQVNENLKAFVAWNWKANGAGVSNTDGSITSTVSANTTAGFSIVTFAGNASGSATVGHGLGVAPDVVIVKRRDVSDGWPVYHSSLGVNKVIELHSTSGQQAATGYWGLVTSDYFGLSAGGSNNRSGSSNVAYCFAEVEGYSKFGSYTGNGSADGTFVYLGFRPAFIILKRTDSTGNWTMYDSARSTYNASTRVLYPNLSNAEDASTDHFDWLSNGFKMKSTNQNTSGGTFIFMAFAEHPFKHSLAQ